MTKCDHYLANDSTPVGNLIESSRNAAALEWRPAIEAFYPQPADLTAMPDGSWLLRIDFSLKKHYTSKAEGEFRPSEDGHEIQNPIVRDHLMGLPMVRPTTWKGHMMFAARLEEIEGKERLFGSASGEKGEVGRLHFFPTFFEGESTREVVTPLSRVTRTPVRGPIDFEVLKGGSRGCFHLALHSTARANRMAGCSRRSGALRKGGRVNVVELRLLGKEDIRVGCYRGSGQRKIDYRWRNLAASAGPEKKAVFEDPKERFLSS